MNTNIEQKIEKAFDWASANSALVHLNEKQADKFIDYTVDESVIIKQSRVVRMVKPIEKIAKMSIWDNIWQPATRWVAMDESRRVKAWTSTLELVSKEIIAEILILDDELQDNIEWAAFANHLLSMIAKKWVNQLEEAWLYWKKVNTLSEADNINWYFEWAISRAESNWIVVDANDTWLFSDRYIERAKLTKLYKSFPTKFRKELDGLYVPNDIAIDFEDLYNTNTTTAQWAENRNRFWWTSFTEAPLMKIDRWVSTWTSTTTDAVALAWATVIPVADTADFTVWEWVQIVNADWGKTEEHTITVVNDWVSIEIDWWLVYEQDNGSVVNEVNLNWTDILYTAKKNLVWGIQKDITIERDRQPRLRWTVFVMTARMDFQVENENAIWLLKNLQVR